MKIKTILLTILLGIIIVAPALSLAQTQFKQEQNYPKVGGTNLVGQSASKSVPQLVKYLFNLVVWLCILAAIITLIVGGIQYVASSGSVSKMSAAKTRIYSAFLGLAILVGTYLVLRTINPDINLPTLTYVPIKQGIVFFTYEGYCRFMGHNADCSGSVAVDASIINDLVQANQAKVVSYSSPDLTKEFGPLAFDACPGKGSLTGVSDSDFPKIDISADNARLNFADFEPYTFALWGKRAQGAKLTFYDQLAYQTSNPDLVNMAYDYRGKLDKTGEPIVDGEGKKIVTTETHSKIKDIVIITPTAFGLFYATAEKHLNASNFFSGVGDEINDIADGVKVNIDGCGKGKYFTAMASQEFRNTADNYKTGSISHPPVSVRITWSTPGVYLADAKGEERYFDSSVRSLKDSTVDFDQEAATVKIINDFTRSYVDEKGVTKTETEKHDFLAILHQEDNFSGHLKIYFQARKYDINSGGLTTEKAQNKFLPVFPQGGELYTGDKTKFFDDKYNPFSYFKDNIFGHLPSSPELSLPAVVIRQHQEAIKNTDSHDKGPVNEVVYGKILTSVSSVEVYELAESETGCQEVRLCTEKQGRGYCIAYVAKDSVKKEETNTVFYPMPVYTPQNIPCPPASSGITCEKPKIGEKEVNFRAEIKSILIQPEGKCAVVLFENYLKPATLAAGGWIFDAWSSTLGPGSHSQVFTISDLNLEDNQIGQCGSDIGFGHWLLKPCASAIAVYPIK